MVKVYGINSPDFEQVNFAQIMDELAPKPFVQVDTETYGFDPYTCDLMCFQLGNRDNQFVIHPSKLQEFKPFLEDKTLIGHAFKFDLKFLYHHRIIPSKVFDTFLAETVLTVGIKDAKRGLAPVAKKRLDIDLDKSIRDGGWKQGLTKEVIEYSADDVKWLEDIKFLQEQDLTRLDLHDALDIENKFVRVLAYIEYCGFRLDKEKWKQKCEADMKQFRDSEQLLNKFIRDNKIGRFINSQMDLFNPEPSVKINWQSPKQVIELFNILKIPVSFVEKGETKESVSAKVIEKHGKEFPFVKSYLQFKEYQKLVSTYGENFFRHINPVTGRLHTSFKQIMDTGRLSSGGKNKKTKEEYINFQNIPSDKETRACFICNDGNTLIGSDYSGQEQIVLANRSMDRNLLEFYDKGLADMHSFVASKMYPELQGLTLDEIKDNHKDKRQNAKSAGFAINYGGNGTTIAQNGNMTQAEGDAVYNGYFQAFPGLAVYFEQAKAESMQRGYILINEISRRKTFITGFDFFLNLRKEMNRAFWEKWKKEKITKSSEAYRAMKDKISRMFAMKGDIERQSLNYPIQGTSAEITKLAGVYFFEWIIENNLFMKVLIPNTIHDEYVAEAPLDIAPRAAEALQECMVRAGEIYCKRVPLKAEPELSLYWKK